MSFINSYVGTPSEVLRSHSDYLTDAISRSVDRVVTALHAKRLIPSSINDDILSTKGGVPDYSRAAKLMSAVNGQLKSHPDPESYLITLCHVLKQQDDHLLKERADSMLKQLGLLDDESGTDGCIVCVGIKISDGILWVPIYIKN